MCGTGNLPSPITGCSFSPFCDDCFLAGCRDGLRLYRFGTHSLRLLLDTTNPQSVGVCMCVWVLIFISHSCPVCHRTSIDAPLMFWDVQDVCAVQWSPTRPCVFFCISSTGDLLVWDLLQDDRKAVVSHSLRQELDLKPNPENAMPSFCILAMGTGPPSLAVTLGGKVLVRAIAPALSHAVRREADELRSVLDRALSA